MPYIEREAYDVFARSKYTKRLQRMGSYPTREQAVRQAKNLREAGKARNDTGYTYHVSHRYGGN